MKFVMHVINSIANKAINPPFDCELKTGNYKDYIELSTFEIFISVVRKYVALVLLMQYRYLRSYIDVKDKNILWIHSTTENIGDSLMKLSSIAYLYKKEHIVDLCLPSYLVDLYQNNAYCNSVFSLDKISTARRVYDLIIIDSIGSKPLRLKNKYFKHSAFVTLYGYFNYFRPDYNLTLFSFFRMQYLLKDNDSIEDIARPFIGNPVNSNINVDSKTIAIIVGGIGRGRVYKYWEKVIEILDAETNDKKSIILVGSENGIKDSKYINSKFVSRGNFINTVGKLTLTETASVISHCDLIVGTDGGLLHIASALKVKIVALFVDSIKPEWRFTKATRYWDISSYNDVNDINPINITHKILEVYK